MKCLYINRDAAAERRSNVEASFSATAPADWQLIRVPACDAGEVASIAGALKPAERACWMSHRKAIEWPGTGTDDVLIVEDDTAFSRGAFATLPKMLAAVPQCDLIFTELMPTDIGLLARFAKQWNTLRRGGNFMLQNLARTGFIGASAYVVRGASKGKVLAALDSRELQEKPYDIALGELVRSGRIEARVCFPFLTTPSADADRSSIQSDRVDLRQATLHAYRRLMFVERDLAASRAEVTRLQAGHGDEAAPLAGGVFAALLSEAFPDEW